MSLKTSNLAFKKRVETQIENEMMRKAIVKAQETIGANRQRMVDELGNWEEWRDDAKQIRNHVLANLDAYLYQLSEKVTQNGGHVFFAPGSQHQCARAQEQGNVERRLYISFGDGDAHAFSGQRLGRHRLDCGWVFDRHILMYCPAVDGGYAPHVGRRGNDRLRAA